MTTKKLGRQTVALANPPTLAGHANVVGKKEGEGPLASSFDLIGSDDTFGEATWEKSESAMQKQALALALDKAGQAASAMDWLFAGDLLNQCIGSSFAAGGVAANTILRADLMAACAREGVKLYLPPLRLCGDNGAMIGAQGYYEYLAGARADLSLNAYATRDIDDAVVAYRAQVRDIFA